MNGPGQQFMGFLLHAMKHGGAAASKRQEQQAQIDQSFADTLPKEMQNCCREDFEALGFRFQEGGDDALFFAVEFPAGWRKQPTTHPLWTHLLDGQGRRRGSIFFKGSVHDRAAHVLLLPRFQVRLVPSSELNNQQYEVWDNEEGRQAYLSAMAASSRRDLAKAECERWIAERFPNWQSPIAYWAEVWGRETVPTSGPKTSTQFPSSIHQ